ncbi:alpha-1,2-fucosyltransferase [Polaribacter aquimarinus]|uniref:Alpha-1,2-fucosyltransferase n=1 Tax=Polaribacter aquimarinus TaxID=2100726 RepID=A0A2U2J7F4_9FLAO|nr:alpha-1,2-fucosyltransferase [uncultured Polaribacter sp.]PWG04269.1 alpha-1,2-fucosyltransferase [Polaribacter aquimarinus]
MGINKVIIYIDGGLGNQMFQFAFASIIAKKNNSKILIDNSFFDANNKDINYILRDFGLSIFNINYKVYKSSFLNNFFLKFIALEKYIEPSFDFNQKALKLKPPIYIKGYFQSHKYFYGHESYIRKIFTFPEHLIDLKNIKTLDEIQHTESISIHIRRGDYVDDKTTNKVHGTCSLEYYLESIKMITENKLKNFCIYFFSDDIDWVKENFNDLEFKKQFIDNNKDDKSWIDMFLMSKCKHNIIANSSFSFWGAWLNSNKNKQVIAPKQWFLDPDLEAQSKNLIPPTWIRI